MTPDPRPFAQAMLDGLSAQPKQTSPQWLYDARGSALFEQITELPEYYPTRTEIALLQSCMPQIAEGLGRDAVVIELGSGSSRKTPLLLAALDRPAVYAPVDISPAALAGAFGELRQRFPNLALEPVVADFTEAFDLPAGLLSRPGPRVAFFPGSTLGNFTPAQAAAFLAGLRGRLGPKAVLLLGLDTVKDEATLLRAYDDAQGVTAAFNLNLLERMNRELGTDIDVDRFEHEARWNAEQSRIEMHLVSRSVQRFMLLGEPIDFLRGESIHTENSVKYSAAMARDLFRQTGWQIAGHWTAPDNAFAFYRLHAGT